MSGYAEFFASLRLRELQAARSSLLVAAPAAAARTPVILSAENLPAVHVPPLTSYEDVTFVNEEATEDLTCAVCTHVAFDPPNQTCGHVHCRACLRRDHTGRCPKCRAPAYASAEVNGFVQRAIVQLRVKCKWHINGCAWQSELGTNNRNLLEHLQHCQERSVKCHACGKVCRARKAATHPDRCEARMVRCTDCKEEMRHKEYLAHRTPVAAAAAAADGLSQAAAAVAPCNKSSLCSNGCTDAQGRVTVLPTSQLRAHVDRECECRLIKCSDCPERVEERYLGAHQRLQCLQRIVSCEHCKEHMAWILLNEHQQSPDANDGVQCRGFVLCENRCKKAEAEGATLVQLRTGAAAAHKALCPLRQEACDLCHTLMLWSAVDGHRRQQCMQRVVTCHHCGDSLTFEKLQNEHLKKQQHQKKAAPCASMQLCALGCKTVHRKDASEEHASKCAHRPSECPCCNPTVKLKHCDVMTHVKQRLADASQHDKMASLLIRLAKENKQGLQSAQQKSAQAVDEARKEKQAFAKERHQWHTHRDQNDAIHQRSRGLADFAIKEYGLCRADWLFSNCKFGARCKYKHKPSDRKASASASAAAAASARYHHSSDDEDDYTSYY